MFNERKYQKQYRKKHRKRIKQTAMIYYKRHKKELDEKSKKYYQDHYAQYHTPKEKYLKLIKLPLNEWTSKSKKIKNIKDKARILVHRAVRKRRIIKPNKCDSCGKLCQAIHLHGHHYDYGKWWNVEWLCHFCHKKLHKEMDDATN